MNEEIPTQIRIRNRAIGFLNNEFKEEPNTRCSVNECPLNAVEYLKINDVIYGVYCKNHSGVIIDLYRDYHPETTKKLREEYR